MKSLKSLVLTLFIANLLMLSCNKDDNANTAPVVRNNVINAENEALKAAIAGLNGTAVTSYLTGTITNEAGEALDGVSVSYGETIVTTNSKGRFTFGEITLDSKFNLIKANKDNYLEGFKTITPTPNAYNTISMQLLSQGTPQVVNASAGGSLTIDEVVTLNFNTDSFITLSGEAYTGNVNVVGRYIAPDASNFAQIIPGTLVGLTDSGTFDALISYGMLTVELEDDNGNTLEIAGDRTVTVEMPLKGNTEASIPLWHFNETHGLWIEAGVATKVGDVFVAEVTHFSTWNLDVNETGYDVEVTIIDENNIPLANQSFMIQNENGDVLGQVYSDNNGEFTLLRTPENLIFTLQLLCGESSSSAVTDVSSGTVTVVINAIDGSARNYTIQGSVNDCDASNNPITHNNKYFTLTSADGTINYGGLTASDGTFSLITLLCDVDTTTPYTLEATVTTDNNTSKETTTTITFSGDSSNLSVDFCGVASCDFPNDCFVIPFEDPNFEQAVRSEINKPTGAITYGDVKNIENLDLFDVSNISGIEHFTNLVSLDINFISQTFDLSPLAELPNFTSLSLEYEQISDLSPLAILTNLTSLDISTILGSQISDLSPLANLTNLTNLRIYTDESQISDLNPLANLTNLISLDISSIFSGQISDLSPLANLSNLTSLSINTNEGQISDLSPLANLTNLMLLHLRHNQISDISPLLGLTNLTDLDLANNQISDISTLANLTNLTNLSIDTNQISNVSALVNLTGLTDLDLYFNQISDISSLTSLSNLTYLNLGSNQISNLNALANLTSLSSLYLGSNQITDLNSLSSLVNLNDLHLGNNQISDVSPLISMTNLISLSLHHNLISDVTPLCGLGSSFYGHIDLYGNNLTTTDIDNLQACLPNASIMDI